MSNSNNAKFLTGAPMRHVAVMSATASIGLMAIFAAAVWFNVLNLVTLVGASGETAELAASYLRIIIPSLPILVASIVASAVLRSHGAASSSMYVTILGGRCECNP